MIEIINLKKEFAGNRVLDGVHLKIKDRETVVVLGLSGTGKSVLLKCVVGLLAPDEGKILINGESVLGLSEARLNRIRKTVGFLFQGAALYDSMNLFDNLAVVLREHTRFSEREIKKRVQEKLALVGLSGADEKMPADLSGGMKKRAGLARAIVLDPQIVLYDEPTTGLDPIRADTINRLINRLRAELGVTSIVVTHDMTSAFTVADRLALLYDGKILVEGTSAEIKSSTNAHLRQFIEGRAEGPIE